MYVFDKAEKALRGVHVRNKLARVLAGVLAVGLMASCASGVATAAPASAPVANNSVVITQDDTTGAITVAQSQPLLAAQVVKFDVSSDFKYTDPKDNKEYSADPELFQLLNGATLKQVDVKIAEAGNWQQDPVKAATAMAWFNDNTKFFGGLSNVGQVKFDLILTAGTYYVAQMQPVPSKNIWPSNTAKTFKVTGPSEAITPYAGQQLTVVNTNGPDKFSVTSVALNDPERPNRLHNGPITIRNKTGSITSKSELHFFQIIQVGDGTTQADVNAWLSGTGPDPTVKDGSRLNFGTLSTQRTAHVYLNVVVNKKYLVASWIPDRNSGLPHMVEREFLLVDVVAQP